MRCLTTLTFIVVVASLVAQALSLAVHPQTTASTPAVLSRNASYGTYESGTEPVAAITSAETLRIFLAHGIEMALDLHSFTPLDGSTGDKSRPMSRAAWQASPYYREGLHFDHWSKAVADREARRYDTIHDRRFDAAWHPIAACWGYWLGRFLFLWIGVGMLGTSGIVMAIRRIRNAHS